MTALEDVAGKTEFARSSLSYIDFWRWYGDGVAGFQRLIASPPDTNQTASAAIASNEELRRIFLGFQVFFIEFLAQRIETDTINRCYMRLYMNLRMHDAPDGWCADPYLVWDDEHFAHIQTARSEIRDKYATKRSGLLDGKVYPQLPTGSGGAVAFVQSPS